ncbi:MAG: RNA polymerase sigma-70 factor [Draconibacterium sp.]
MTHKKLSYDQKADALEALFSSNYSALCFFAFSFVKDEDEAEDIAQDAFEGLWNNYGHIENTASAQLSYLYNSVRNKCLNRIRHNKVKDKLSDNSLANNVLPWEDDHLGVLIRSEVYKELFNALDSLPPQCRKIYQMTYFKRMSEQEIADMLSISINTVKTQKQRGKKLLKEALKDLFSILVSF